MTKIEKLQEKYDEKISSAGIIRKEKSKESNKDLNMSNQAGLVR